MRWILFISFTILAVPASAEDWVLNAGVKTGVALSRTPGASGKLAETVPVDLNFAESVSGSTILRPYIALGAPSSGFLELAISYHDVSFRNTTRKQNILGETYERLTQTDEIRTLHIPALLRFAFVPSKPSPRGLQNLMWGLGGSLNYQFSHRLEYTSDTRTFTETGGGTIIDGVEHRPNLDTYFALELSLSANLKLGKLFIPFELGTSIIETGRDVILNESKTVATQVAGFEWQIFLVSGVGYEFATF